MEQGWDPEVTKYFRKIINTIFIGLLWLMAVLTAGLYYRSSDAVIPLIGLGYKDYAFSFTYDATVSTLSNYNNTRGAFEFSLVKQGMFGTFNGNRRQTICPSFKN